MSKANVKLDLTVVTEGMKALGEAANRAGEVMKKLGHTLTPQEKVLYVDAVTGKRRWKWRAKGG